MFYSGLFKLVDQGQGPQTQDIFTLLFITHSKSGQNVGSSSFAEHNHLLHPTSHNAFALESNIKMIKLE